MMNPSTKTGKFFRCDVFSPFEHFYAPKREDVPFVHTHPCIIQGKVSLSQRNATPLFLRKNKVTRNFSHDLLSGLLNDLLRDAWKEKHQVSGKVLYDLCLDKKPVIL
jgi:hypothetical protein